MKRLMPMPFLLAPWIGLLFAISMAFALAAPAQAARLALVIGNDGYRNLGPTGVLQNAGNDARLMAATLGSAGFEVVGGVRTNLDRSALWDALEKFKARVGRQDEVVFYFSGHGVQLEATQLLLPVDITNQSDDQVARDAVPLHRVQELLRDARFALLVVDACRDNPFPPKAGFKSIGQARGLLPPSNAVAGSVVVMAAANGERALDYVPGTTTGNGLFTHELVKALKTPGLDVLSAVRKTRTQVLAAARKVDHAQKPTYVDEMAEGEFVLFASLVPEPVPRPRINPEPVPGPSAAQVEQQAWSAAQRANTVPAYNAYLSEYPNGSYAAAARVARAGLEPVPIVTEPIPQHQPARPAPATLVAGQVFKDCSDCPEMVVIPAGSFQMGSNDGDADEKPVHSVSVKGFAMGKYEVTRGQFAAFVSASGHNAGNSCAVRVSWLGSDWKDTPDRNWRNTGFSQTDSDPVACVNWEDAQAYVRWLSQKTGQSYRLPSESEWEYACRAGANQTYCGSNNVDSVAVYGRKGGDKTQAVGTKQANAWGLYDTSGNVWEWTQDCFNENYNGAPSDGSVWTAGNCGLRVLRGGSWSGVASRPRAAYRNGITASVRINFFGFRLARIAP